MSKDCEHKNKVYAHHGVTLTCLPPINISYWICEDCGYEGQDRHQEDPDEYFKYDHIRAKFNKSGSSSFTATNN